MRAEVRQVFGVLADMSDAEVGSRLVDLHTRGRSGQIAGCGHLPPGTIAFAALWAPTRVVCAACMPALRLSGDADRTCDRCGAVGEPGVHPVMVAATAWLLVSFGLCSS